MTSASEPQGNLATTNTTTTTTAAAASADHASRRQPSASASSAAELASAKLSLEKSIRRFPDFPIPGINFLDIMPWFLDPEVHATLLNALELQLLHFGGDDAAIKPDVIVGLDARGFLFGPSLALKLGASFVPVRKKGKLPGPCVTAEYMKEYGADYFQMQEGTIAKGQKVLIVDDIIATGTHALRARRGAPRITIDILADFHFLYRWFCRGRWRLGQATWWHSGWFPFHCRNPLPQRPRQARQSPRRYPARRERIISPSHSPMTRNPNTLWECGLGGPRSRDCLTAGPVRNLRPSNVRISLQITNGFNSTPGHGQHDAIYKVPAATQHLPRPDFLRKDLAILKHIYVGSESTLCYLIRINMGVVGVHKSLGDIFTLR